MAETLPALRRAAEEAARLDIRDIRFVATMAARIAINRDEFLQRAQAQGTPVEVLSGEDEARLGFLAVAEDPVFRGEPVISIVDPGGQSTELVSARRSGDHWDLCVKRSYPIGTLRLLSEALHEECPDRRARLTATQWLDETIGLAYRPGSAGTVVVLGASGTNLVSVRDRLIEWDPERVHGAALDYEEVSRAVGWLSELTLAERAAVPGLEPGREGTIHAGALILERFLYALRSDRCRVSVKGWRHAYMAEDGFWG